MTVYLLLFPFSCRSSSLSSTFLVLDLPTMAYSGPSQPLRVIRPRPSFQDSPPISRNPEEGKLKRASIACTECKRRRVRVILPQSIWVLPSISLRLLLIIALFYLGHTLTYFSVPTALPAMNVLPIPASVSTMKQPTSAGRSPLSTPKKSSNITAASTSSSSELCGSAIVPTLTRS